MASSGPDEFESGRLFEFYTRYVTEPESKRDVYGYAVLVVGYLLGMAGMVIYLAGPTEGPLDPVTVLAREASFSMAGVGLALTLLGIVLILPVRRRGLFVAILGTGLGLAAAVWFLIAYPSNWGVGNPDLSSPIVTIYTIGVALSAGVVVLVPIITGERSYFAAAREALGQEYPDIMLGKTDRDGAFTIYQGSDWTWRFIDQAAIAASSNSFLSRLETEDRVDTIKEKVQAAGMLEITHAAFRLYQTEADGWRWQLMQENGNIVANSSEEYPSRQPAESSVNDLKEWGPTADVISIDGAAFETYPENGGWRWRLIDDSRTPLATGPNRYRSRETARSGPDVFTDAVRDAPILSIATYGIELYEEAGDWTWRLLESDLSQLGESTRSFESKGQAEDTAYQHLEELGTASIIAATASSYDIYNAGTGSWGWRLVTPEDRSVAVGASQSGSRSMVREEAQAFRNTGEQAEIVEIVDQDFELYQDGDGWHWRLVDRDRNVRAHSVDPYESQSACADAIEHLRLHAPDADLIEFETAAFQIYEADEGRWRWRLIDEDGNVLADSSEGEYESRDGATSAMATLQEYAPDAEQLEIETAAFELFEEAGEWGWRLVDDIGETIARGTHRYESRSDAQKDMDALRDEVSDVKARVVESGVFQVYPESDDSWQWRFFKPDGSIISQSPGSFGTRHEAEDAIETLQEEHLSADINTVGSLAILVDQIGEEWSWEIVDYSREAVARASRNYETENAARGAVADVQAAVESITVFEIRDYAFVVSENGDWTWALLNEDHEPIAEAPTRFDSVEAGEDAVTRVSDLASDAELIEYDDAAFEISKTDGGWQWEFIDEDRAVIAAGTEIYNSRSRVDSVIDTIKNELREASVLEIERAAFEFHESDDGWRWRLIDATGIELAESLNEYETRSEAREAINTMQTYAPEAWTTVTD